MNLIAMLTEETYNAVFQSLNSAVDAMRGHAESSKDEEDAVIYKRLIQLTQRVIKQGKKAQKAKTRSGKI